MSTEFELVRGNYGTAEEPLEANVVEKVDTRTFSTNDGQARATRTFLVWGKLSPIQSGLDVLIATDTVTGITIPAFDEPHPEFADLRTREYRINQVEGSNTSVAGATDHIWEITWQYETEYGGPGTWTPNLVQWGTTQSSQFVDAWRAYDENLVTPTIQSDPDPEVHTIANPQPDEDVAGIRIHSKGIPKSSLLISMGFEVERHVSAESWAELGPLLATQTNGIGKRNENDFIFEGDAGAVLMTAGASVRVGQTRYILKYRFVLDEWYHLRQNIARRPNGDAEPNVDIFSLPLDNGGQDPPDAPSPPTFNVDKYLVYWVQPFPETFDYGLFGITNL